MPEALEDLETMTDAEMTADLAATITALIAGGEMDPEEAGEMLSWLGSPTGYCRATDVEEYGV